MNNENQQAHRWQKPATILSSIQSRYGLQTIVQERGHKSTREKAEHPPLGKPNSSGQ